MISLIDSDIVIDYVADDFAARQLVDSLFDTGVAISMITYMEVFQGRIRASEAERAAYDAFLARVPVLPLSMSVARRCAVLRDTLRSQGKRVRNRALDLLTAATALEHDLTLVTRNIADYEDIPGLRLYR